MRHIGFDGERGSDRRPRCAGPTLLLAVALAGHFLFRRRKRRCDGVPQRPQLVSARIRGTDQGKSDQTQRPSFPRHAELYPTDRLRIANRCGVGPELAAESAQEASARFFCRASGG